MMMCQKVVWELQEVITKFHLQVQPSPLPPETIVADVVAVPVVEATPAVVVAVAVAVAVVPATTPPSDASKPAPPTSPAAPMAAEFVELLFPLMLAKKNGDFVSLSSSVLVVLVVLFVDDRRPHATMMMMSYTVICAVDAPPLH